MSDFLNYIDTRIFITASIVITGGIVSAILAYIFPKMSKPLIPKVEFKNQSAEISNGSGARQNCMIPPSTFQSEILNCETKTLLDVMQRGLKLSKDGRCLGWREQNSETYSWLSYSEVISKSKNLASGLVNIGMKPGQSTFVGIYSKNCVEWILTDQACYNQSTVPVPLYDTLGPQTCSYIIKQANISIVICDTEDRIKNLISKAHETPTLKKIIAIKGFSQETKMLAEEANIELHVFEDVEAIGKENPVPTNPCKSEDLCVIFYTSGTTGNPKGVMLTHSNMMTTIMTVSLHIQGKHEGRPSDVMISYLPLAHVLEKGCEEIMHYAGGAVGFYSGDLKLLTKDLQILKPTFFLIVPRIANKIYNKVYSEVEKSGLKKFILKLALRQKEAELRKHVIKNNSIWDKIVFKKIRQNLGGRVRFILCSSAYISPDVMSFLRCAMGCLVLEAYGATECLTTLTACDDFTLGHVGPPLCCTHVKLVDVPEMNYFANKGCGEICVKGSNGFKGYFKDPEMTAETIDSEGWIHMGDIGMWTSIGTLKVIDRKKSIFKLAQGEYIAPEKIESIYRQSKYVSQIFVHGESKESYVVAIVVPEQEIVELYCKENDIEGSWEELCKNEMIKTMIFDDISAQGKNEGLKSFEQVKKIYIHPEQFSVENGLLTPTLKVKRHECCKYFKNQIIAMY